MEVFHRIENAWLHNSAQAARVIGDDLWNKVLDGMSNRDAARLACAGRYFSALVNTRAPKEGLCADDQRLLAEVTPFTRTPAIRRALIGFKQSLLLCMRCGMNFRFTGPLYALPLCHHAICGNCWRSQASDIVESQDASTTGEHSWTTYYMPCTLCGARNSMDENLINLLRDHTFSIDGRLLDELQPISHCMAFEALQPVDTPATHARLVEGLALRIDDMADRFRQHQLFLRNRFGNRSASAAVKRELAAGAHWISMATGGLSDPSPGRFAWS